MLGVSDSDYDHGQTSEGAAFVYRGSASGLSLTPAWRTEGDQENANFVLVGTAGNLDTTPRSTPRRSLFCYWP
jgi:hypothetical protein